MLSAFSDIREPMTQYDTSDYQANHSLCRKANANGKLKDETNDQPPLEIVGVRSNMYNLLLPNRYQRSKMLNHAMLVTIMRIRCDNSTFVNAILADKILFQFSYR